MMSDEHNKTLKSIENYFKDTSIEDLEKEFLEVAKFEGMTAKEYLYGEWKIDQRTIDLQDMLYNFYNEYCSYSNRSYIKAWKKFNDKLLCSYTKEEINAAKKVVSTWRLDGE